MGRKSRRNTDITPVVTAPATDIFPTAIYARLSVENSGKDDDGAAIENQIDVCKEYIRDMPDLQLVKVYQDNGWTGTVMHRPAFDELMEDVKSGIIKAVVVRDLSRFARNYIETGTYLESVFPKLDVRFISVKERFDTLKTDGTNESLMVPLQSLINDLYSKDISRKVEAALRIQMEEGEFKWRQIPYGYKWDDEHINIIPDEEMAPFVRDIFRWFAEGVSKKKIAERLDEAQAPKYQENGNSNPHPWSMGTIYGILDNPAYIGKRVYGCRHSAIYKGIRLEKMPESEWYVTENAHEPLVSKELYEKVHDIMRRNSEKRQESMRKTAKARAKMIDLFEGKIFCADCGYRMYFHRHQMDVKDKHWYADYYCSSSQTRRWLKCTCHRITQEALDKKVLEAVRMQMKLALDYEEMIGRLKNSRAEKAVRKRLNDVVKSLSVKTGNMQKRRKMLYEDYADGIIDEEEYLYMKDTYEREYEQLNRQLEAFMQKRDDYIEAFSSENRWIKMMKGIRNVRKLTKDVVDAVVEKVSVSDDGRIEIIMKYQDIFDLTEGYITQIRGEEESSCG